MTTIRVADITTWHYLDGTRALRLTATIRVTGPDRDDMFTSEYVTRNEAGAITWVPARHPRCSRDAAIRIAICDYAHHHAIRVLTPNRDRVCPACGEPGCYKACIDLPF